jgi:hypothetical protein
MIRDEPGTAPGSFAFWGDYSNGRASPSDADLLLPQSILRE